MRKKTSSGILVVDDASIEDFAYRQLQKFKERYIDSPSRLDIEKFVEFYLGIDVLYYRLSMNSDVLGMTAIKDGRISIIGESGEKEDRVLKKGQICVDCVACKTHASMAFTLAHEAAHAQFDRNVDLEVVDSACLLYDSFSDFGNDGCCSKKRNPKSWMEHHANKYAAYILMPEKIVRGVWIKEDEYLFGNLRHKPNKKKNAHQNWTLIRNVAEILGVSNTAMAWRVKELMLISDAEFEMLNIRGRGG